MAHALGFLLLVLDLWATYDIVRRPVDSGAKMPWLVLVWLFPVFGGFLYILLGRSSLGQRPGRTLGSAQE